MRDLQRLAQKPVSIWTLLVVYVSIPGFRAVAIYRLARFLLLNRVPILPTLLKNHCLAKTGADILPGADIGPGLVLPHPTGIVVGTGAKVGRNVTILQNVTIGEKYGVDGGRDYPSIGDDVVIGAGAAILGGVRVGTGAVVGANAVVIRDVPAGVVVAGNPARIVRAAYVVERET